MLQKKQSATVEELAQHAHSLAKAFNVPLAEIEGMSVMQSGALFLSDKQETHKQATPVSFVEVRVPPIRTQFIYAVALHEMGHYVAAAGFISQSGKKTPAMKLVEEHSAWEWAEHYALIWTPEMSKARTFGLETYEQSARGATRPSTPLPPHIANDPLFKMLDEMVGGALSKSTSPREAPPFKANAETISDFLKRRK